MSQTRFLWRLAIFFTIIALFTATSLYLSQPLSQDVLTAAVSSHLPEAYEQNISQPRVFFVNEKGFVEDVGILYADGSIQR
ncbi:MAG: hypothetical protein ACLFNM_02275 [Candidatus Woesearchaeota archaeon]